MEPKCRHKEGHYVIGNNFWLCSICDATPVVKSFRTTGAIFWTTFPGAELMVENEFIFLQDEEDIMAWSLDDLRSRVLTTETYALQVKVLAYKPVARETFVRVVGKVSL